MNGDKVTVVALSGGVDSATAAALLVEAGERVVGITMRLYDARSTTAAVGRCCGPRDIEDARQIAAHLGIPFYVANYEAEFQVAVVEDFVAQYGRGHTPNPCIRCNQHIKFTPLLARARAIGAESLATGHYARVVDTLTGPVIGRARDAGKDQSYFLFGMPREALARVRFPLGDLTKDEVRGHARRLGLPNAEKAESQEICFVPDGDHVAFVAARTAVRPGPILDGHGAVVGRHDGIHRFTVGQRRGIGTLAKAMGGDPRPHYVVKIDAARDAVVVGSEAALERREIVVENVTWWVPPPSETISARVQIRYRRPPCPARIEPLAGARARVLFERPERAVAPGQAAVFYEEDRVVGGGFIAAR